MNGKQKIFICFAVCLFVFIAGGISGYFCGRENDSGTGNMADQYRKEIADSKSIIEQLRAERDNYKAELENSIGIISSLENRIAVIEGRIHTAENIVAETSGIAGENIDTLSGIRDEIESIISDIRKLRTGAEGTGD